MTFKKGGNAMFLITMTPTKGKQRKRRGGFTSGWRKGGHTGVKLAERELKKEEKKESKKGYSVTQHILSSQERGGKGSFGLGRGG